MVQNIINTMVVLCFIALYIMASNLKTRVKKLEKAEKVIEIIIDKEVMDTFKLGEDLEKFGYSLQKTK